MFKEITKDNWLLFAQQNYDNPTLEKEEEFYEDIKRFKYLKRLFRKYDITNEIKVRLVLNHIVVLQNVFCVDVEVTLLLFKIQSEHWKALKSFLIFLNLIQSDELGDIEEDKHILEVLREL